jgi:hypothetical protein
MTVSIQDLMKTEHYHPSLNSAVFDGPLRIYFAQSQESLALKIYFQLQKVLDKYGYNHQKNPSWYFVVLVYPSYSLFKEQSPSASNPFQVLNFQADRLILTHGELQDGELLDLEATLGALLDQSYQLHESKTKSTLAI